jgi:hypothetical protein
MRRMSGGKEGENQIIGLAEPSRNEGVRRLYKTKPISGSAGNVSIDEIGGCDCNDEMVGV